jgi:hypothetical protein
VGLQWGVNKKSTRLQAGFKIIRKCAKVRQIRETLSGHSAKLADFAKRGFIHACDGLRQGDLMHDRRDPIRLADLARGIMRRDDFASASIDARREDGEIGRRTRFRS